MAAEMDTDLFTTLDQARDWLAANVDGEGAICPCCDRFDKVYNRRINASSVKALAGLFRATIRGGPAYYHYSDFVAKFQHGDFPKLAWIDLLERAPVDTDAKKSSGMYRITDEGLRFVRGDTTIPARLLFYHDRLVGVSPERKFIHEIWTDFNYTELMAA